ncbi:MAG TPA: glycosyltransferase family 39 protein, partial [Chloroflexia bacterium]|nr:glycosyltransferase family 39 protein [Chloroflexia bacterium]
FMAALRGMPRRLVFLGLLVAAALAAGGALPLFISLNTAAPATEPANTGAWLLWIAALLLFGAAWAVWESSTLPPAAAAPADPSADRLPRGYEWLLLAALFALGLLLRLPNLQSVPPGLWFDEAQNGIISQELLAPNAAHPVFLTGLTQMGALYFYAQAVLIWLFGPTIWPLRVLPALSGAVVAPLLYLLGARLYGWRVGLAAAGLVAVSAWNITFSRVGFASMVTVAFDVAVYVCAAQALRTGRLGYYAGAGVLLGLGLHMYYVARLVPVILLAVLLHRLLSERGQLVRSVRGGLLVFAVGALLAFMPVGLFAIQQPVAFAGRVDQVSIFNPQVNGGDPEALPRNLTKHLLMFNFVGDANGRHNLPSAPMLDDITAALFFLGLAACVLRAWRWQYFFPVAWWAASMAGGVLSVPFEAPQSHRSLEASVTTALLAGIVLGEFWQLLTRPATRVVLSSAARVGPVGRIWPARWGRAVSLVALVLSIAAVATITVPRYFAVQAADMSVWKDMTSGEAEAGRALRRLAGSRIVYLSPAYMGIPDVQYQAPGVTALPWPGLQALPFRGDTAQDVALILDPPSTSDLAYIARMYPHAVFDPYRTDRGDGPLLYTITIPATDIAALHGVHARLYDPGAATPREEQTLPGMSFSGSSTAPAVVRLSTTLHVDQYATYAFDWHATDPAAPGMLLVDGYAVPPGGTLPLGIGLHSVVATDTVRAGSVSELRWGAVGAPLQPVAPLDLYDPRRLEPHGLTGVYRSGPTPDGAVGLARVDPVISFFFYEGLLNRPYNVEWTGRLYVPETGTYGLSTEQITQSHLDLDGRELISNTGPNQPMEVQVMLTAGWHDLRLRYLEAERYAHMYLYWTPPGRAHTIIPSAFLWPQMGQYPTMPESGRWPTLAESDGVALPVSTAGSGPAPGAGPVPQPTSAPPTNVPPVVAATPLAPQVVLGAGGEPLPHPRGVAADAEGDIYVFTEGDSKIHKFDRAGASITSWSVQDAA